MEEERAEHYILEQANQSKTLGKLAEALAKAQGEMEGAKKDSTNPFFHQKYADLASVWDACRKPLSTNGLSVVQTTDNENGKVVIITTLLHSSGEWIRGRIAVKPMKEEPQSMGSAITYGRRYSLAAIVGISPEDDDAEGAMERDKSKSNPPLTEPQPKASSVEKTTGELKITKVVLKEDIGKDGKPYKKYTIVDSNDNKYTTFSDTFAGIAKDARDKGFAVVIEGKKGKFGLDLISIEKVSSDETPPPGELVDEETVQLPQQEKDDILDLLRSLATEPEHVDAMCAEGIGKKTTDEWTAEDVDKMRGYIGMFEKTKEAA